MNDFRRYFYFFWNSFRRPRWDTGISPPELMEFIRNHSPGHAIDLGCGTGTNVISLTQHGWDATGVDYISNSIYKAKRKAISAGQTKRAHFICDSVARLDGIRGPFQLALDIGCYQGLMLKEREAYRTRLSQILAPGATFLIYGMIAAPELDYGLTESDLSAFNQFLLLQHRDNSTDHNRSSTWWQFTNGSV